jgi:uncharacterized membrane protein
MTDGSPPAPDASQRAERLRALAALTAIGASLAVALARGLGPWSAESFADNSLAQPGRVAMVACAGAGALLFALASLLLWMSSRAASLPAVARLLAPLGLAGFMPGLLGSSTFTSQIDLCLALALSVLVSRPLFRLHFAAYRDPAFSGVALGIAHARAAAHRKLPAWLRGRVGFALALLAACSYAAYMAVFTVLNHLRFRTTLWDLAQFDSEFYNTLHGLPFRCPALMPGPAWGDLANHAHFGIWLLTPLYALHPAAETLLVLQALLVGAGAVPLYRFAARRLPQPSALLIACAYLLYPPLHGAQFFDFHFQPVAACFVLFAVDFLDQRRMRWFAVFFAAALSCREDVSIGFAAIGLYVLLFTKRSLHGAVILGVSAFYFALMRFVIMPSVGAWGFENFYQHLIPSGQKGFGAVVVTLVANPVFAFKSLFTAEKFRYALQILTPLAFLPLSRPKLWLSVVLGTLVTLLTGGASALLDLGFQYGASFAPYVFLAAALAVSFQGKLPFRLASPVSVEVERRAAVLSLAFGTLLSTWHFGAIPPRAAFHSAYGASIPLALLNDEEKDRLRRFNETMALVPKDAIVAAGDKEMPHVSNRMEAWNMHVHYDGADFLIFDPSDPQHQDARLGAKARSQGWQVVVTHPRVQLLKKPDKNGAR